MIAADQLVFVHLHKCGGSFLSEVLLRFDPSARRIGYHHPRALLPPEHAGKPLVGSVRDPWDFYVSYFFFQKGLVERVAALDAGRTEAERRDVEAREIAAGNDPRNGIDVLFDWASADGTRGFAETTRALLSLGRSDAALDEVLPRMPDRRDRRSRTSPVQREGFRGMNVLADELARIRGTGLGLLSFLFDHLYSAPGQRDAAGMHLLRAEDLREALVPALRALGASVTPPMEAWIRGEERVNQSVHGPSAGYYDRALAEEVGEAEAGIVSRFGYAPPVLG